MKLYIVKSEFWKMEDYTEGRAADSNVEGIYADPQKALDHISKAHKKITKVYCNRVYSDAMKIGDSILIATRASETHKTDWRIEVDRLIA